MTVRKRDPIAMLSRSQIKRHDRKEPSKRHSCPVCTPFVLHTHFHPPSTRRTSKPIHIRELPKDEERNPSLLMQRTYASVNFHLMPRLRIPIFPRHNYHTIVLIQPIRKILHPYPSCKLPFQPSSLAQKRKPNPIAFLGIPASSIRRQSSPHPRARSLFPSLSVRAASPPQNVSASQFNLILFSPPSTP